MDNPGSGQQSRGSYELWRGGAPKVWRDGDVQIGVWRSKDGPGESPLRYGRPSWPLYLKVQAEYQP
jgi:hypothetical protein